MSFEYICLDCDYTSDYEELDQNLPSRCPGCRGKEFSPQQTKDTMMDGGCFDSSEFPEPFESSPQHK